MLFNSSPESLVEVQQGTTQPQNKQRLWKYDLLIGYYTDKDRRQFSAVKSFTGFCF
jgi:hypothetical protein